ncbi:hypothetical protein, partial [Bifidobacterium myosotis]
MTGNTKVWRAPLAGLASVAMIATMGVAASTANAAPLQTPDVQVTLDANGGKFVGSPSDPSVAQFVDTAKTKLQLTDSKQTDAQGVNYADGVFEHLYDWYGLDSFVQDSGYVFTGWYTSPDAGGSAVDPSSALQDGTTLYAHWAVDYTDESEEGVTFNLLYGQEGHTTKVVKEIDPDGAAKVVNTSYDGNTVYVRLADGDQVADWQVPSEDVPGDGFVFGGFDGVSSAKRGTKLGVKADKGVIVNFPATSRYQYYKDGENISGGKFDVLRGASLTPYQAVTGAGTSSVQLAAGWQYYVGNDRTHPTAIEGSTLNIPAGLSEIWLLAYNFQPATQYNVSVSDAYNKKSYFTPSTSTFEEAYGKTLEDVTRVNTKAFEGWYDPEATVTYYDAAGNQHTIKNSEFFNSYNLTASNVTGAWDNADPVKFDFSVAYGQGQVNVWALFDAAARYRAFTVKPLYDQAKSVTVKLYEDKTIGEQLKAAESQWERSGYSIEGYYTRIQNGKALAGFKVDLDSKVDDTHPEGDTLYVNYTADSKYGKYGLLYNLKRGYSYVKKSHHGKVTSVDVDKDNDGKWDVYSP